jgi:uncharacterized protein YgbK (DUF1537 family)
MQLFQYNNESKSSKSVVVNTSKKLSEKSDIRDGMTTNQIANVISNKLMTYVEKALENVKKH